MEKIKDYVMGTKILSSNTLEEKSQQLTFVVTQECNLECKYCYMVKKNNKSKMTLEVAKKAIDFFVDNKSEFFDCNYIILDFIGGEPLLEIDLISEIVDYFKLSTYRKHSSWFGRYRISIGTNGTLYNTPKVQDFIARNINAVSIGITLDGTKEKHNMQRIYPDGRGSYDDVVCNLVLSLSQGIGSGTKVTIGHEDLKFLKDSIVHLWSLGLKDIPANVVFEDVWELDDPEIFQNQLIDLADYIIDNHLWDKYNVTLFSENIGFKISESELMHSVCGTGKMYCIDFNGDIYSCVRFMDYSLNDKDNRKYGNIYDGINKDKMRAFRPIYRKYLNENKCLECAVNSECVYCAGQNYNMSKRDTLYDRSVAICNMHKARVRANNYYWAKLYNKHGVVRKIRRKHQQFLYFLLSSDSVNYCNYVKNTVILENITAHKLLEGLKYAFDNFYQPVFIHSKDSKNMINKLKEDEWYGKSLKEELSKHIILEISPFISSEKFDKNIIYVFDKNNVSELSKNLEKPCIYTVNSNDIYNLSNNVINLLEYTSKVNINIIYNNEEFDLIEYKNQLQKIADKLEIYLQNGYKKEVSKLTDRIFSKSMNNCYSGEKNLTYGPNGTLYLCPAFYYKNVFNNLKISLIKTQTYLKNSPVCDNCDAYQCQRCIYMSKNKTGEFNIPSKIQCEVAHLERTMSKNLLEKLKHYGKFEEFEIPEISYTDPLDYIEKLNQRKIGGNNE